MEIKALFENNIITFDIKACSFLAQSLILPYTIYSQDDFSFGELNEQFLIYPNDLKKSKYFNEIKNTHLEFLKLFNNFKNKEKIKNDLKYLIPVNYSVDFKAIFLIEDLEKCLTYMLSHPLEEIRLIAKWMHEEALKLSPGLLKHVAISEFDIKRREKIENYISDLLWEDDENEEIWLYQGIEDEDRVNIIFEWDLDNHICASIIFENGRREGISYDEALSLVEEMDNSDKEVLMKLYLEDRWSHDRMPRALQHSSIMFEYLVDFWAYRDIQRHRATSQLWQWATAIHWYDYPEFIELPWMEEFKEKYDEVMTKSTTLAKKVVKENSYLSEYVCALWHLIRTTFEMNPGQVAYVFEMRTTPQWHQSYRKLFIESYKQFKKMAPVFSRFIRVWTDLENASRKVQEEKAEEKRRKLWI